ncbi:recombinase family protein [Mycobacterium sp.]|uniref:recombinase family protein n=1 Tax=Mycobacterium sp. TaxID=1785 RepID=UPI003F9A9E64
MTRTAIYTRISQDATGQRAGVTRQLEDCTALADRLGFDIVDTFDDNDLSAYSGKTRPGFEAMLDGLKRGEFDAIICWHPDRLYRSLKDLERLIDVADATGAQIRTVNGGDLDLGNSTGKMLARILGSVSRQESEHKGERQRRANQQHRDAGRWSTARQRAFGYSKTGGPLEPEASMLKKAATDVLDGISLRSIATDWNRRGVTTARGGQWTNLSLRRCLMNPVYAALMTYKRQVVGEGDWEPLWDADTHKGLVAYLSDPSRRTSNAFERKHMGSGVYRCGRCGGTLVAAFTHGPDKMLYICRTTHLGRMGKPIDELVETAVLEILGETDIRSRLSPGPGVDLDALHARRAALQSRLDELAGMFAEGAIDASQLRRGTNDLRPQLAGVDKVLADAARTSPALRLLNDADGDPDKLIEYWSKSSADIKGKIIAELMSVTVNPSSARGPKGFDRTLIDLNPKV